MGFKLSGWSPMKNRSFKGGGDARNLPTSSPAFRHQGSKNWRDYGYYEKDGTWKTLPPNHPDSKFRQHEEQHGDGKRSSTDHHPNWKYGNEKKWIDHDKKRGYTHDVDDDGN